jgi:catechol 2,3-dioxygenase-like lactoylglutathione lyase family enzyme
VKDVETSIGFYKKMLGIEPSKVRTGYAKFDVSNKKVCDDALLAKTADELHQKFGIEHTTLQIEFGDPNYPCRCGLV